MSETTTTVLNAASARIEEILPMLERWVRTNSYSANVEGVNRVSDLLAEGFSLPSLSLERIAGDGVGDHLVWRTPSWDKEPERRVLLIGHHDTVFPPGGFDKFEIEGDVLTGPGVLDMKGGLATVRAALATLDDCGLLSALPLALVSVGDEEIGSLHSAPHLRRIARGASAALVFEAGRVEDKIVTQRKGTGGIVIKARGKAAHAGNHHEDGINAIWGLSKLVDSLQGMTNYEQQITVNVGLFRGGEARNTVPHEAECSIDFRFLTKKDGDSVVEGVRSRSNEVTAETGVRFEIEGGIRRYPLERSDESVALCREYGECARASGLGGDEAGLYGGGSDANTVSAVGVPAIDGLGPRGKGFHTHDEFIELSSLPLRTNALIRFLVGRIQ